MISWGVISSDSSPPSLFISLSQVGVALIDRDVGGEEGGTQGGGARDLVSLAPKDGFDCGSFGALVCGICS